MMMIKHQMDDECPLLSTPKWLLTLGTHHPHNLPTGHGALRPLCPSDQCPVPVLVPVPVPACPRALGSLGSLGQEGSGEGASYQEQQTKWKNGATGTRTRVAKNTTLPTKFPYHYTVIADTMNILVFKPCCRKLCIFWCFKTKVGFWCFIINSSLITKLRAWCQHNASK